MLIHYNLLSQLVTSVQLLAQMNALISMEKLLHMTWIISLINFWTWSRWINRLTSANAFVKVFSLSLPLVTQKVPLHKLIYTNGDCPFWFWRFEDLLSEKWSSVVGLICFISLLVKMILLSRTTEHLCFFSYSSPFDGLCPFFLFFLLFLYWSLITGVISATYI